MVTSAELKTVFYILRVFVASFCYSCETILLISFSGDQSNLFCRPLDLNGIKCSKMISWFIFMWICQMIYINVNWWRWWRSRRFILFYFISCCYLFDLVLKIFRFVSTFSTLNYFILRPTTTLVFVGILIWFCVRTVEVFENQDRPLGNQFNDLKLKTKQIWFIAIETYILFFQNSIQMTLHHAQNKMSDARICCHKWSSCEQV